MAHFASFHSCYYNECVPYHHGILWGLRLRIMICGVGVAVDAVVAKTPAASNKHHVAGSGARETTSLPRYRVSNNAMNESMCKKTTKKERKEREIDGEVSGRKEHGAGCLLVHLISPSLERQKCSYCASENVRLCLFYNDNEM